MSAPDAPWPAPAKLNLFLRILGRRPDGYHDLQTVFQFIDLCDELSFEPREDGLIVRASGPEQVPEDEDLTVRAAMWLREFVGDRRLGVSIRLHKRIPVQGGLGGGSSDAATTLVALNQLWKLDLPVEALAQIGRELGADVPVFVHGRAAWAEGVGERLTPVDLPEPVYLVVCPSCTVSTHTVFQAPELTRNSPPTTIAAFFGQADGFTPTNDCEPVVRRRYPQVAGALDWLGRHAPARLTGTGSCVFAAFGEEDRARAVMRELPPDWQGCIARGLNRSPLLDRVAKQTIGA